MSNKRIIDLEDSSQLDINDFLAVYNAEPTADVFTFKRRIVDILNLKSIVVNGKTGSTITLTADDISDTTTSKKFVTTDEKNKISFLRNDLGSSVFLAGDGSYKTQTQYSGTTTIVIVTGNTSIIGNSNYLAICDSTSNTIDIDLPITPVDKQVIKIKDGGGSALINNITVNGNGKIIEDSSSTTSKINSNYGSFELIFIEILNKWVVTSSAF